MSSALQAWTRALTRTAHIAQQPQLTLPVLIDHLADRHYDHPALLSLDGALSYRGLAEEIYGSTEEDGK